jgi:crossover junction endodeoxyribonuclease RuvC
MLTCGIDPGFGGAVAVLDAAGGLVAGQNTPALVRVLHPDAGNGLHAILEEAQAIPGQGIRSMGMLGGGFGLWLGILATLGMPYTRVRPSDWKQAMGLLGKDKEAARLRAHQLFPGADLRRKKDHGRAETLLLA